MARTNRRILGDKLPTLKRNCGWEKGSCYWVPLKYFKRFLEDQKRAKLSTSYFIKRSKPVMDESGNIAIIVDLTD